jgi:hypothetical protein
LGGTLDYTKGDREGYSSFNEFVLIDGKDYSSAIGSPAAAMMRTRPLPAETGKNYK